MSIRRILEESTTGDHHGQALRHRHHHHGDGEGQGVEDMGEDEGGLLELGEDTGGFKAPDP